MTVTTRKIKEAIRTKYAWPGGYTIYLITSDGGILCTKCARQEYRQIAYSVRHKLSDGWRVTAIDCTGNYDCDTPIHCDHCHKPVEKE